MIQSILLYTGGGEYAEAIFKDLQANVPKVLPSERFKGNAFYKDIRWLKVNRVFYKNIEIFSDCFILGFYCTIGPYSGLCTLNYDNDNRENFNLWDRWCYYERKHFCISTPYYKGFINVNILQDDFDTSSCKINFDFDKYKKKIVLHAICYQGNSLEIKNKSDGKLFPIICINAVRVVKAAKHFVGKRVKKIFKCL